MKGMYRRVYISLSVNVYTCKHKCRRRKKSISLKNLLVSAVQALILRREAVAVLPRDHRVPSGPRVAPDRQRVVGSPVGHVEVAVLGKGRRALEVGQVDAQLRRGVAREGVDVVEAEPELLARGGAEALNVLHPRAVEVLPGKDVLSPLEHGPPAAVDVHLAEDAHGAAGPREDGVDAAGVVAGTLDVQAIPYSKKIMIIKKNIYIFSIVVMICCLQSDFIISTSICQCICLDKNYMYDHTNISRAYNVNIACQRFLSHPHFLPHQRSLFLIQNLNIAERQRIIRIYTLY